MILLILKLLINLMVLRRMICVVVEILVLLLVYRKSLCMLVCCFMASMFVTHLLLYINCFFGFRFAGGRQPKQPIPPGDSAFFYHGICVATSSISGDLEQAPGPAVGRQRKLGCRERELQSKEISSFIDSLTVTSHSCKLNICLGGGGFNCISFYSGTSFVFNVGQQVGVDTDFSAKSIAEPSLPPPFPSTIIGGTGRYV